MSQMYIIVTIHICCNSSPIEQIIVSSQTLIEPHTLSPPNPISQQHVNIPQSSIKTYTPPETVKQIYTSHPYLVKSSCKPPPTPVKQQNQRTSPTIFTTKYSPPSIISIDRTAATTSSIISSWSRCHHFPIINKQYQNHQTSSTNYSITSSSFSTTTTSSTTMSILPTLYDIFSISPTKYDELPSIANMSPSINVHILSPTNDIITDSTVNTPHHAPTQMNVSVPGPTVSIHQVYCYLSTPHLRQSAASSALACLKDIPIDNWVQPTLPTSTSDGAIDVSYIEEQLIAFIRKKGWTDHNFSLQQKLYITALPAITSIPLHTVYYKGREIRHWMHRCRWKPAV